MHVIGRQTSPDCGVATTFKGLAIRFRPWNTNLGSAPGCVGCAKAHFRFVHANSPCGKLQSC
jgi:hypothetical protein